MERITGEHSFDAQRQQPLERREHEPEHKTDVIFVAGVAFLDRGKGKGSSEEVKYGSRYVPEPGGESRLYAAELLAKEYESGSEELEGRDYFVLMSGGLQPNASGQTISRAETAAKSLVDKHGIPAEKVHALTSAPDTIGNIESLFDYLDENKERLGNVRELTVITEDYHIPRLRLMLVAEILRRYKGVQATMPNDLIEREARPIVDAFTEGTVSGSETGHRLADLLLAQTDIAELPIELTLVESAKVLREKAGNLRAKAGAGERYAGMLGKNPYVVELREKEAKGIFALLRGSYRRANRNAERGELLERLRRPD